MCRIIPPKKKRGSIMIMGTIFWLGEQNGEKQSRKSNSKYNFMQYFDEGTRSEQWDLEQSPRSWGIFENFCVKSILTRLLLTVSYRKNCRAGCTSCPPIILLGVAPPVPAPVGSISVLVTSERPQSRQVSPVLCHDMQAGGYVSSAPQDTLN